MTTSVEKTTMDYCGLTRSELFIIKNDLNINLMSPCPICSCCGYAYPVYKHPRFNNKTGWLTRKNNLLAKLSKQSRARLKRVMLFSIPE